MLIQCAHCGKDAEKATSAVNRARKVGMALYCDKQCSSDARRMSTEEKKARKVEYDRQRREGPLREALLQQKKSHYEANAKEILAAQKAARESDPELKKRRRDCQRRCMERPEWKKHKRDYDRQYRAEREFGEMAPAYLLLLELEQEVERQEPDWVDLQRQKGTLNKSQRRRRSGNYKDDTER
jgi:hypothetical protein